MEKRIKEAFSAVTMSERCAGGIERAMEEQVLDERADGPAVRPMRGSRVLIAAACVTLALLLVGCAGVIVEKIVSVSGDRAHARLEAEDTDKVYLVNGTKILINWTSEGNCVIQSDEMRGRVNWLEEKDGRVWFVTLEERIDITDRIGEEEPYIYVGVTADGTIRYYDIVGGTCGPEGDMLSGLGWIERYYYAEGNAWTTGEQKEVRFVGKEDGSYCAPWYDAALE